MSIDFRQRVRPAKDVLFQKVAEEAVLLNLDSEKYHGFDAIGTRMWEALTASSSIAEASDLLLAEYDVEREKLENDIREFIQKMLDSGLVEVTDD